MTSFRDLLLYMTAFFSLPVLSVSDDFSVIKQSLSEDVMMVSTKRGFSPQLVIAAEKGLTVFNTLWGEEIASQYRSIVQQTFNRKDFIYVINESGRLDMIGGNAVYPEAEVVAHEITYNELKPAVQDPKPYLQKLIDLWHGKAEQAKIRLKNELPGSEQAAADSSWQRYCDQIASGLSNHYNLRLPSIIFSDSLILDLGDKKLELYSFGEASFAGGLLAYIPEEQLIFTGALFSDPHLIPTPNSSRAHLDISRWLYVLDKLLTDDVKIKYVICGGSRIKTKQWLIERRNYIRELWQDVRILNARGQDLPSIQDFLSLEKKFAYLKNWDIWEISSPENVIKEHRRNVQLFWAQLQNFASDQIEKTIEEKGIHAAIRQYYELSRNPASKYYFDEPSFNALGYKLLSNNQYLEAITVFKLNAETYPQSANVYDSLAEAYMKSGNTDLAIVYYRKSLQFNPENVNAQEMLNILENIIR